MNALKCLPSSFEKSTLITKSLLSSFALKTLPQFLKQIRCIRGIRPCVEHDVEKPIINIQEYDPEGLCSSHIHNFIRSRQFENDGGRQAAVIAFPNGNPVGVVTLSNFVFGANARIDIIHRVSVWERAIIRQGNASTKDRSEVRGGGRKPRPQKGSGRSRQGSIRSPHWRGGGICHGPKPRSYFYSLPEKVVRMGIRCALSSRMAQGDLHIVDSFDHMPTDVESLIPVLSRHGWQNALAIDRNDNLDVMDVVDEIPTLSFSNSHEIKVYEILKRNKVLISLSAIRRIEHEFCEDNRIITSPYYGIHHELAEEDNEEFTVEDSTYTPPRKHWQNNKKKKVDRRRQPRRR